MIPSLISITIYTILSAFWNYHRIRKGEKKGIKNLKHWTEDLLIQGIFMAVVAFIFCSSWDNMFWLFLAMTALYWIIFDPLLNYLRNRHRKIKLNVWCYLGYGNIIDRLLMKVPCKLRIPLKLIILGIFIYRTI